MKKIGVFIPCYNCFPQVLRVLERVRSLKAESISEILIVDNTNDEGAGRVMETDLRAFSALPLRAFRSEVNRGLGRSFKKAWLYFAQKQFDGMLMVHGDDQADPGDFVEIIERFQTGQEDQIVFGARFHPQSRRINYSLSRTWANQGLNLVMSLKHNKRVFDLGSGLNFYPLSLLEQDFILDLPDGIDFDLDLLAHVLARRIPHRFEPISWRSADERSTINPWRVGYGLVRKILFGAPYLKNTEEFHFEWKKIN